MKIPEKHQAIEQARERLGELLGLDVELCHQSQAETGGDATVCAGHFSFHLVWRASSSPGKLLSAIERLRQTQARRNKTSGSRSGSPEIRQAIALLVVPFMGEAGSKQCRQVGLSWIDLSGNADIQAPGLRILVTGKPNRFKPRGRPANLFAPKSARIARWLLMNPGRQVSQQDLARQTGIDKGFASRIVARLEQDGLVARNEQGRIWVPDPDLLLDAWGESYDFEKHAILRGHVPARSGEELLRRLDFELGGLFIEHAATGLAAAWLMTRFAGFRIVTFYLRKTPSRALLADLSFREEDQGANTWLVVPKDEGVFQGAKQYDGILCVDPIQVYLDLKAHPERAREAAEHLRAELLNWRNHG